MMRLTERAAYGLTSLRQTTGFPEFTAYLRAILEEDKRRLIKASPEEFQTIQGEARRVESLLDKIESAPETLEKFRKRKIASESAKRSDPPSHF